MNVEALRKSYDKLTPFERASLITAEAVGQQRDGEVEALAAPTLFDSLWVTEWNFTFFAVATYAMFKAVYAEKLSLLAYVHSEQKSPDAPAPVGMVECMDAAGGWIAALKRLADQTGAPLMEAGKLLDSEYAARLLDYAEKEGLDGARQYEVLCQLWEASTRTVNREDEDRARVESWFEAQTKHRGNPDGPGD